MGTQCVVVVAWALTVFLATWNNAANLVPAFRRRYVAVNVALSAGLLLAAGAQGLTAAALGLAPRDLGAGLAWGTGAALLVTAGLGTALAVPALRPVLRDPRVADLSPAALVRYALVRIPLGTVLLEEVAFRGVLLAVWARDQPLAVAVLASSAAFGLWHVVPTAALARARGGRLATVAAGVVVTGLVGTVFCWLRIVSGSLAAPALVHLATNSLGALAAWLAWRVPGSSKTRHEP